MALPVPEAQFRNQVGIGGAVGTGPGHDHKNGVARQIADRAIGQNGNPVRGGDRGIVKRGDLIGEVIGPEFARDAQSYKQQRGRPVYSLDNLLMQETRIFACQCARRTRV